MNTSENIKLSDLFAWINENKEATHINVAVLSRSVLINLTLKTHKHLQMKLTRAEHPSLFQGISEAIIEDSYSQHRRGSTFYTRSIVEFKPEHRGYYPEIENFNDFVGTWETNQYVRGEDDTDWTEIDELIKVQPEEEMVSTKVWKLVDTTQEAVSGIPL